MAIEPEIREFVNAIGAAAPSPADGEVYHIWKKLFRRSNYFWFEGNFLVVKLGRAGKVWGVLEKIIDFLNKQDNYYLVLLINNHEGWVYSKKEINNSIEIGDWKLSGIQYLINFSRLKDNNSFISPNQFLKKIGTNN
jgi:hypothetical protein